MRRGKFVSHLSTVLSDENSVHAGDYGTNSSLGHSWQSDSQQSSFDFDSSGLTSFSSSFIDARQPLSSAGASTGLHAQLPESGSVLSTAPTMADEVAFLCGVDSSGQVAAVSGLSWNFDNPATYNATSSRVSKWGGTSAGESGGVVKYYFDPDSDFTSDGERAFVKSLALWSDIANISFTQTSDPNAAQVKFYLDKNGDPYSGQTSISRSDSGGEIGGTTLKLATDATIHIHTGDNLLGSSIALGWYGVLLHEEGHLLGLGHAGPYDGSADPNTQQYSAYDTNQWSVMSYFGPTSAGKYSDSYPIKGTVWSTSFSSWMPLDVLAAQQLYGLPTSTPLSGGQTFGFNCNVKGVTKDFFDFTKNATPVVTLWDKGANNTLDLSGFSQSSTIDLHAGSFSSCDGMVNNLGIAFNTHIDTAVGGPGGDRLQANDEGNKLVGGAGADWFSGGAGNDKFQGGTGSDTAGYVLQTHQVVVDLATETATGTDIGTDTLIGVENLAGGTGNDQLSGDDNANLLSGNAGSDVLVGENGRDTLLSGGGADKLSGGAGNDLLNATDHFSVKQTFDKEGLPYALLNFSGPAAQVIPSGATGNFLRLAYENQGTTNNVVAFQAVGAGSLQKIAISFDFDMSGGTRADGIGMALLPVSIDPDLSAIPAFAEEPNLPGALGFGFDVYDNGGETDNEISMHFDGHEIDYLHPSKSVLDLAGGETIHAAISAVSADGGSLVTLTLRPDGGGVLTVFHNEFVSGLNLAASVLAFGGRTGGFATNEDIDNVQIIGTGADDSGSNLSGGSGDDTLWGGKGNDRLIGGPGADSLAGGKGMDRFVYASVAESTSSKYDTITDFDFKNRDLFELTFKVKNINAVVNGGTLSAAHFDSDLTAALTKEKLAAHDAVLFTPTSGSLKGEKFLVVDWNGRPGYQAGDDFVVHLDAPAHLSSLDVSDFTQA